ncbi:MAG: translesion error-prone DNA polymerase V autoproteolytic subunit [Deltaproteobacteria bacterium]|jgi:DNA polymerase V|nr:translesion error-prone DNA polymerase V autoproteolytic subunit [Deltaproteobacteria bacterium]
MKNNDPLPQFPQLPSLPNDQELKPLSSQLSLPSRLNSSRAGSPLYGHSVNAGFPSPAEDYIEDYLDLHKLMVHNPPATFFLKVKGYSMVGAGVRDGDLLVVDRSLEASHGKIVVAAVDGELTVKRLITKGPKVFLAPENESFPTIEITDREDAVIWGVVTYVVHKL